MKNDPRLNYTVIRTKNEQLGWSFAPSDRCLGTIPGTLKTGDYSLVGYEKLFVIERKGSSGEFAQNVVQDRFEKELVRLEEFVHPFIILEFTLEEIVSFPVNSGIPEEKWSELRVKPLFFMKRLNELNLQYRTKILFCGGRGWELASSLFKRITEKYMLDVTVG